MKAISKKQAIVFAMQTVTEEDARRLKVQDSPRVKELKRQLLEAQVENYYSSDDETLEAIKATARKLLRQAAWQNAPVALPVVVLDDDEKKRKKAEEDARKRTERNREALADALLSQGTDDDGYPIDEDGARVLFDTDDRRARWMVGVTAAYAAATAPAQEALTKELTTALKDYKTLIRYVDAAQARSIAAGRNDVTEERLKAAIEQDAAKRRAVLDAHAK